MGGCHTTNKEAKKKDSSASRHFARSRALDQIDKGELIYKNATSSPNSRRNPNSSPVHVKSSAPVTPVIALYNYAARTEEELSFFEGDHLEVIGEMEWSWCKARIKEYDTMVTGFIPTSHIARPDSIEAKAWFFNLSNRSDVERILMASINHGGAFLIRPSSAAGATYAISIRYDGRVKHFLIKGDPRREGYYIVPQITFSSLSKLVEFYSSKVAPPLPKLEAPCRRLEAPPTYGLSHQMADKWELPRHLIKMQKRLGTGNFGDVFMGVWNNTTKVAVKTLKQGNLDKTDFLKEAENMKKLYHPKIVQLFGVCTREEPFLLVTELMAHGDLLNYLKKGKGSRAALPELIDMATQICSGMAYLEEKKFVHRDLAARNVLVGEDNTCKVADFGLSRLTQDDLYVCTLKNVKLPVKWTAPEALKLKEFSTKSDVWSFGILLYEIIEKGQSPYPGLENANVYPQLLRGYRMPQSIMPHCPDKLYAVMLTCWNLKEEERPTFAVLLKFLESFYDHDSGKT